MVMAVGHEASPFIRRREMWWAVTDSNRRHPACKAGALPTELTAHQTRPISRDCGPMQALPQWPKKKRQAGALGPRLPYFPGGSGRKSSDRLFQLFRGAEGDLFAR